MSDVRWAGFTHAEIYRRVQAGPGRAASTAVESAWADTEAVIRGIEERLATAIRQAGGDWEGAAADATRSGLTPLGRWATDAAGDARLTATGITAQGEQAAWLRNAMPSPTAPLWDEPSARAASDPLYLLEDAQALEQRGDEDAAQAVHLMNTYTSNSYDNIRMMNYWTLPPTVTVEAGGGVGSSGAAGAGVVAAGAGAGSATPIGVPGLPPPSGTPARAPRPIGKDTRATAEAGPQLPVPPARPAPHPGERNPVPGSGTGAPGGWPRSGPDASGPTGRTPSGGSVGPAGPAGPGSRLPGRDPGPLGRIPAGPAIEPSRGAGPAAEPTRGAGPPFPGSSEPTRGAIPGAAPGTTSGATSAARTGMPGHPGLYPPMLGFPAGATDREHRRPDYLVDDGDAFADDRWLPPPVLGAADLPPPRRTA